MLDFYAYNAWWHSLSHISLKSIRAKCKQVTWNSRHYMDYKKNARGRSKYLLYTISNTSTTTRPNHSTNKYRFSNEERIFDIRSEKLELSTQFSPFRWILVIGHENLVKVSMTTGCVPLCEYIFVSSLVRLTQVALNLIVAVVTGNNKEKAHIRVNTLSCLLVKWRITRKDERGEWVTFKDSHHLFSSLFLGKTTWCCCRCVFNSVEQSWTLYFLPNDSNHKRSKCHRRYEYTEIRACVVIFRWHETSGHGREHWELRREMSNVDFSCVCMHMPSSLMCVLFPHSQGGRLFLVFHFDEISFLFPNRKNEKRRECDERLSVVDRQTKAISFLSCRLRNIARDQTVSEHFRTLRDNSRDSSRGIEQKSADPLFSLSLLICLCLCVILFTLLRFQFTQISQ